jgi:outer membrane protein TolC
VDDLVARARESRAERDGLQERAAALRATALASDAVRRPQISALAAIEPSSPNARFFPRTDAWKTSWDLGVALSWSLFDGGKSKADSAAATAQAAALAHRLEDFDAGVGVEVRQRLLDLQSNRAALEASGEAVAAATEARRVVEERFAVGVATSTEVLDAQVALLEAALERTRIEATLRLSEARLIRTVGAR